MILFQSDMMKERCYIHSSTNNRSALKVSRILGAMGIKNCAFHLALTQKDLEYIDPHNLTDPSQELKLRILYECKVNPWYYFREVVRIPGAGTPLQFKFNRGNLAMIWCFYAGIDNYQVQPRQTGKTMTTQSIMGHVMYIGTTNFTVAMMTKDTTLLQDNVKRLKDVKDNLPEFLLNKNKLKDIENMQSLGYAALNNRYMTYVAQKEELAAEKLGRGNSIPVAHIDEVEFFANLNITYPSLLAACSTASSQAKALGLPHANILTSTAGNLATPECQYALSLINQAMPFSEKFYDFKDREELEEILKANSTNNMVYSQFSYQQLGFSEEWFKETVARTNATPDQIKRDYLGIRTSGGDDSIIPPHLLEKIKQSEMEPVHTEITDCNYIFRWYIDPKAILGSKNRSVIIGLDTSENIGRDFTSITMLDSTDMSVICTARCNESDLIKFGIYLGQFMARYSNTLLVPERRSTASMIIGIVCSELRKAGVNPWTRIFNMIVQNRNEPSFMEIDLNDRFLEETPLKKYLGYTTTGSGETSRDMLYKTVMMKYLELNSSRVHDANLIREFSELTRKNGRIDHTNMGHDDGIISLMVAAHFLFFAKNTKLYNIPQSFLSSIDASGNAVDPSEKNQQQELKDAIANLKHKLERTSNPVLKSTLGMQIRNMESMLNNEIITEVPISQEQVIHKNTPKINIRPSSIARCLF